MTIEELKAARKLAWTLACRFDGIDPKSKFVVFSDNNPHVAASNAAGIRLMEARNERRGILIVEVG